MPSFVARNWHYIGLLVFGSIVMTGVILGAAQDTSSALAEPAEQAVCGSTNYRQLISDGGGNPSALTQAHHPVLGQVWNYRDRPVNMVLPPRVASVKMHGKIPWVLPGNRETGGHFSLLCVPLPPPIDGSPIYMGTITSPHSGEVFLDGSWKIAGPRVLERNGPPQLIVVPDDNIAQIDGKFYLPGDRILVSKLLLWDNPSEWGPPGKYTAP